MPYIAPESRSRIDDLLVPILSCPHTPGELNYIITRLLLRQNPSTYEQFNALIGVLGCVQQEFYRRKVGPYEDAKRKENGDVNTYDDVPGR